MKGFYFFAFVLLLIICDTEVSFNISDKTSMQAAKKASFLNHLSVSKDSSLANNFNSIQDAINAANDNDLIVVYPEMLDTFFELPKDKTLILKFVKR